MGFWYTPLKNYIWQIFLTHLHRGNCFHENFSKFAKCRSCRLKHVRRVKLEYFSTNFIWVVLKSEQITFVTWLIFKNWFTQPGVRNSTNIAATPTHCV
jgi:hypothetical protein